MLIYVFGRQSTFRHIVRVYGVSVNKIQKRKCAIYFYYNVLTVNEKLTMIDSFKRSMCICFQYFFF